MSGEQHGKRERVRSRWSWRGGRLLPVASDVCRGMAFLHERGVIHRDLKPANILISRQNGADVLKLCDFGEI